MDRTARIVLANEILEVSTELADLGQAVLAGIATAESSDPIIRNAVDHLNGIRFTLLWLQTHEGAR